MSKFEKSCQVLLNIRIDRCEVRKYSITLDPDEYDGPRHLFRIRQAKGSAARDLGCTLSTLIVSAEIKHLVEQNDVAGVVFKKICTAKIRRKRR